MARIRSVKPEFFGSRTMARASVRARLTFIGIWTFADDEGRGIDEPRLLKASLWPLDDFMTAEAVTADLDELEALGVIFRYRAPDGRPYFAVRNWKEHQKINRPRPSRLPPPPVREPSRKRQGKRKEASVSNHAVDQGAGSREQGSGSREAESTPDGVTRGGWPAQLATIFAVHIGVVEPGECGRFLAPGVAQHGEAAVLRAAEAWARQAPHTEKPQFLNPKALARQIGVWVERTKPVKTYAENGIDPSPEFLAAMGRKP